MRKSLLLIAIILDSMIVSVQAQSWSSSGSNLYVNPSTTKVGIGTTTPTKELQVVGGVKIGASPSESDRTKSVLYFGDGSFVQIGEWEADDALSFKANSFRFLNGKVGINTTPSYHLDVNGCMYLRNVEARDGWLYSYLYWGGHSLVMGSPVGEYKHNTLDLKPGGVDGGAEALFSCLRMYTATAANVQTQKIELKTEDDCWFKNEGNFGIGTSHPTHKLDVRGTIRANEILVNIPSGADFVFEDGYNLMPISQLSSYVKENKHLPEIAPAKSMEEDGLTMGEMQIKLLQKIEELTLYIIQQGQEIESLKKQIEK